MTEKMKSAAAARLVMAKRIRNVTRGQDGFRTGVLPYVKENLALEFDCANLQAQIDLKQEHPELSESQVRRRAYKEVKKDRRVYDNLLAKIDREQQQDPFVQLSPEEEADFDVWYENLVLTKCPELLDHTNKKALHVWEQIDQAFMKNKVDQAKELAGELEIGDNPADDALLDKLVQRYEKLTRENLPQWDDEATKVMESEGGLETYLKEVQAETETLKEKKAELEDKIKALYK